VGAFLPLQYKRVRDHYFDAVKDALGDGAFHAALSRGRAMSLAHGIQYAVNEIGSLASE
jgi:hypothetical protein